MLPIRSRRGVPFDINEPTPPPTTKDRRYRSAKRGLDIAIAIPLLVVAAPITVGVAGAIALSMGRPVLFVQTRAGRHGDLFSLYKFRTMSSAVDADGKLLPSRQRITKLGRLLRRTSIDELPQLFNVVRGEMSLVGPRPLLPEYLNLYSAEQSRRHEVRPGLTGWAQISGRNLVDWEVRLSNDVWYVEHAGMKLDLTILMRTAAQLLPRRGAGGGENQIMSRFTGSVTTTANRPA